MHPDAPPQLTSFNVADEFKTLTVPELQDLSVSRRLPFAVALANITGDLNVGVILRTACVLSAERVFLFGRKKYDRRSTVGAHHYIDLHHYPTTTANGQFDWVEALDIVRIHGYTPVLIEQGGAPLSSLSLSNFHPVCLVFGAEDLGIPAEVCATEPVFTIPQYGVLRSLNVSSAAAIAIHQVATQLHEISAMRER